MSNTPEFGKYEIIEQVGRGGFGTVYKAKDLSLQRLVAIKVLHPNLVNEADFLSRFKQEAQVAAQLEHPNLVPVFDFGEQNGRYFIAMGFMSGGSLRDLIADKGALSTVQAKKLIRQVADGLAYAHNRGLIHRDLKPGNILIDANGNARVCDLGFAKLLNSDSSLSIGDSGGLIGTAAYMAPEIWKGKAATTSSDIYSLACIFVEMLTGKPLFDGDTTPEIMMKHFQPVSIPANFPAAFKALLTGALNPEVNNRTSKVSDFIDSLDQIADKDLEFTDPPKTEPFDFNLQITPPPIVLNLGWSDKKRVYSVPVPMRSVFSTQPSKPTEITPKTNRWMQVSPSIPNPPQWASSPIHAAYLPRPIPINPRPQQNWGSGAPLPPPYQNTQAPFTQTTAPIMAQEMNASRPLEIQRLLDQQKKTPGSIVDNLNKKEQNRYNHYATAAMIFSVLALIAYLVSVNYWILVSLPVFLALFGDMFAIITLSKRRLLTPPAQTLAIFGLVLSLVVSFLWMSYFGRILLGI